MLKIIVIGSPGAGKSTFSRKLKDLTGLPLYYLDMLWHKPDKTTVSREEFDTKLHEILKNDKWIIDGHYHRTLETRLRECDTVFLLDFPLDVCLSGAQNRIGTKREELPWMETEFDEEFKQYIIEFPEDKLPKTYELLEKYRNGKEIIVFHSRKDVDDYLEKMQKGNFYIGKTEKLQNRKQ